MNQNNEFSKEVVLEKSPTGTWAAPKSPKKANKPWMRLWYAAGVVYLIMIAGSYFLLMPTSESIERHMVFAVTEEVRRYDGMAFAGESPQKIYETARSDGYPQWILATRKKYRIGTEGNAGFERIERNYHGDVSKLPFQQTIVVLIGVIAWVVPMALFYAFGSVIDWIKRGGRAIRP
ncbi:MAG: hypothetical protein WCI45_10450 [Desulfuromonadales bacterium]